MYWRVSSSAGVNSIGTPTAETSALTPPTTPAPQSSTPAYTFYTYSALTTPPSPPQTPRSGPKTCYTAREKDLIRHLQHLCPFPVHLNRRHRLSFCLFRPLQLTRNHRSLHYLLRKYLHKHLLPYLIIETSPRFASYHLLKRRNSKKSLQSACLPTDGMPLRRLRNYSPNSVPHGLVQSRIGRSESFIKYLRYGFHKIHKKPAYQLPLNKIARAAPSATPHSPPYLPELRPCLLDHLVSVNPHHSIGQQAHPRRRTCHSHRESAWEARIGLESPGRRSCICQETSDTAPV